MLKFNGKKLEFCICGLLISMYYILGLIYFFSQGCLIDLISNNNVHDIWLMVMVIVASKIFMLFADVLLQNLKDYLSVLDYKKQMKTIYPDVVHQDFKDKSAYIFDTLHDNLSNIYHYKIDIFLNRFSFLVVTAIYLYVLIDSKFFIGGVTALSLGLIIFFTRNIGSEKINTELTRSADRKKILTIWNSEFFNGYKEISHAWYDKVANKKWLNVLLDKYFTSQLKLTKLIFYKNLLSQLFVETPFIVLMCLVLLGVYLGEVTLPQAFVWLGISQFILGVAKDLAKNSTLKKFKDNCEYRISAVKELINVEKKEVIPNLGKMNVSQVTFMLKNTQKISLSTLPGLYQINGDNGTGKTTLLNTITGYCRQSPYDTLSMDILKSSLDCVAIRRIDTESTVFSLLETFDQQIIGPNNDVGFTETNVDRVISRNLKPYLSDSLIKRWQSLLQTLRLKFDANHDYQLSLGEHVILSCLRNWFSWNNDIKLLLVDECDSCLDPANKTIFYRTIDELSQRIAIYMISHSKNCLNFTEDMVLPSMKKAHVVKQVSVVNPE